MVAHAVLVQNRLVQSLRGGAASRNSACVGAEHDRAVIRPSAAFCPRQLLVDRLCVVADSIAGSRAVFRACCRAGRCSRNTPVCRCILLSLWRSRRPALVERHPSRHTIRRCRRRWPGVSVVLDDLDDDALEVGFSPVQSVSAQDDAVAGRLEMRNGPKTGRVGRVVVERRLVAVLCWVGLKIGFSMRRQKAHPMPVESMSGRRHGKRRSSLAAMMRRRRLRRASRTADAADSMVTATSLGYGCRRPLGRELESTSFLLPRQVDHPRLAVSMVGLRYARQTTSIGVPRRGARGHVADRDLPASS